MPDATNVTTTSSAAEIPTQPIPRPRLRREAGVSVLNTGERLSEPHEALTKRVSGGHATPLLRPLADENDVIILEYDATRSRRGLIAKTPFEVRK